MRAHFRDDAVSATSATIRRARFLRTLAGFVALLYVSVSSAEPSVVGQGGLIRMPDARLEPDGTFRVGLSQDHPYTAVWSSLSFFPRVELSGRYTTIHGLPGFSDAPELGPYRDKAADAKLLLWPESTFVPAIAVGAQDYLGTKLFAARYVALTKRLADFDVTAGYGDQRIDGAFGGLRYRPSGMGGFGLLAEYDANRYRNDPGAELSGAARRPGGMAYGVEYRSSWWGAQLASGHGDVAANIYLAIPLMDREFVPKIDEPPPYDENTPRAPAIEWASDRRYEEALARALLRQGFSDIHIRLESGVLDLALTHNRISFVSRAVGRAARTALRLGPNDATALRITYTLDDQPLITYEFRDPSVLERYFTGNASRAELEGATVIGFSSKAIDRDLVRAYSMMFDLDDEEKGAEYRASGQAFRWWQPTSDFWRGFTWLPFNARLFFNDPGAPIRYDTFTAVAYDRRIDRGLYVDGLVRLTLFENVSDIRQPSTSLLPHVRSDIADYRREGGRVQLSRLLLNRYTLLDDRLYGRWSIGYYEEMYAGAGGQVLYLPREGNWAIDLAVDALRQRAPGEPFGFRDYSTVTALTSLHYRLPGTGVTATARAGRFLAKDDGVRFELSRRFRSGIEAGGWYTLTNARDITNPGTPQNPYHDKGIFVSIPLNSMLTKDTQERANAALADYTRDVGQMVISPGDLYRRVERSLVLNGGAAHDPYTDFAR